MDFLGIFVNAVASVYARCSFNDFVSPPNIAIVGLYMLCFSNDFLISNVFLFLFSNDFCVCVCFCFWFLFICCIFCVGWYIWCFSNFVLQLLIRHQGRGGRRDYLIAYTYRIMLELCSVLLYYVILFYFIL